MRVRAQTGSGSQMRRLVSGLTHKLRNPLNAARLHAELLDRRTRHTAPELAASVAAIARELDRIADVVDDFGQLSSTAVSHPRLIDALEVAARVVDELSTVIGDRSIELNSTRRDEPVLVHADPRQLERVVEHLVLNAIDAVERNGRIDIEVSHVDAGVRVAVCDNGPGMSADDAACVFEPFYSTKEGGTGLGLAVCKRIVEQHGGVIRLCDCGVEVILPRAPSEPLPVTDCGEE